LLAAQPKRSSDQPCHCSDAHAARHDQAATPIAI
jgi:hypothetical protein